MHLRPKLSIVWKIPHSISAPESTYFLSLRKLKNSEIHRIRKLGVQRFYAPLLNEEESAQFFAELNTFWNSAIEGIGPDDVFWRTAASSKMQEWEYSHGYLCLLLFTLQLKGPPLAFQKPFHLIFVVSSAQEAQVIDTWARIQNWNLVQKPSPVSLFWGRLSQEFDRVLRLSYSFFIHIKRHKGLSSFFNRAALAPRGTPARWLIVSLFYKKSFFTLEGESHYSDPFFGSLHRSLQARRQDSLYFFDLLDAANLPVLTHPHSAALPAFKTPYYFLNGFDLFKSAWTLLTRTSSFKHKLFMNVDFSNLLNWNFKRTAGGFNFHAEIFYRGLKALKEREDFAGVILPFEGSPYERACAQVFKDIPVLGFSHLVIYPLNLKLFRSTSEGAVIPDPKHFISPGPQTAAQLHHVRGVPTSQITATCALKAMPRAQAPQSKTDSKTVLIALDGLWSTVALLDWLAEHSAAFEGYKVKVRAHPNVPLQTLRDQMTQTWPNTFEESKSTLDEDLKNSFCALYRQTSIGMQALLAGRPVLHLPIDTPLWGDPLDRAKTGGQFPARWVASTPAELKSALTEIANADSKMLMDQIQKAQQLVSEYFVEPRGPALDAFLDRLKP